MEFLDKRITFGGDPIPAWIGSAPKYVKPARKMNITKIAGSNREIVEMEDAWECYDQPYELFVGDGKENSLQPALVEVARGLYKTGWQVLTDDYSSDYFRYAYYQGPFDVENRYTRAGKFNVSFRCRPEWFLVSGNVPVNVSSGDYLENATGFNARPLIHITGSGSGTLTVAGTTVSFTGMTDYLNLDCEKEDCYRLPSENKNSLMTGEFPILPTGRNLITYTGGITSVTITPRYFVI